MPGKLDYGTILTKYELCTLHRLLSCSVDPFERRNEVNSCPIEGINEAHTNRRWVNSFTVKSGMHERINKTVFTLIPSVLSRCPIELGVVRTDDFGTLSPGIFIASISAGLQPQNVKVSDFLSEYAMRDPYENLETMEKRDVKKKIQKLFSSLNSIDNTLAAGLVGDLAEVVLFQMPFLLRNTTIGFKGSWNDTFLPRQYFLHGNKGGHWEMTDSEILSGIDGLFISQQIAAWVQRIRRLKLSQIVEMYYSHRGIPVTTIEDHFVNDILRKRKSARRKQVNEAVEELNVQSEVDSNGKLFNLESHAKFRNAFEIDEINVKQFSKLSAVEGISNVCHRNKILQLIDVNQMKEEVYNFVQILQYAANSVELPKTVIKPYSNSVVDMFMDYARNLIDSLPKCEGGSLANYRPAVDLNVIIDGSRTEYENVQVLSRVAEVADISPLGSKISVIHGSSGDFIVKETHSVVNMFEQLRNNTRPNPVQLSLSKSFESLFHHLINQTETEKLQGSYGGLSKVILIFSQSTRISETDFESARKMMQSTLYQFPDIYFIFVSNNLDTFTKLAGIEPNNDRMAARFIEHNERYRFIATNSINPSTFEKALLSNLKSIPKKIISPFCKYVKERLTWDDVVKRDQFEEYLSPGEGIRYRIHPYYLRNTEEIRIRFLGVDYGDFTVCMSREIEDNSKNCKTVEGFGEIWFNQSYPCYIDEDWNSCKPIYFSVSMDSTYLKCSENDCRFPDQVRYIVQPEGLDCEYNGANKLFHSFIFIMSLILLHIL